FSPIFQGFQQKQNNRIQPPRNETRTDKSHARIVPALGHRRHRCGHLHVCGASRLHQATLSVHHRGTWNRLARPLPLPRHVCGLDESPPHVPQPNCSLVVGERHRDARSALPPQATRRVSPHLFALHLGARRVVHPRRPAAILHRLCDARGSAARPSRGRAPRVHQVRLGLAHGPPRRQVPPRVPPVRRLAVLGAPAVPGACSRARRQPPADAFLCGGGVLGDFRGGAVRALERRGYAILDVWEWVVGCPSGIVC
ncbi:hypothetical protein T484DRAFT_2169966, partial [Baffinella frigidus]